MSNQYLGMTVYERLYVSGLIDKFDEGVQERNVNLIVSILKEVGLTDESINPILNKYGLDREST